MNSKMIITMIISLAIVLPLVGIGISLYERYEKIKKIKGRAGASLYLKKKNSHVLYMIYMRLLNFPLTRGYIDKISRSYEAISPLDKEVIAEKTMVSVFTTLIMSIGEIVIIYCLEPNLQNGILAIYLVLVINNEINNYFISTAKIKLLEAMEIFISDVSHNYYVNRLVDDAILLSMDGQTEEMKMHAKKLYDVVTSTNMKEDINKYNTIMHNKFLKMFLSLCISVIEYSDKKVNGQMLFTANLMHLKKEINIECLKLKKLRHVFSGSVFVAVSVCIPIDAIKKFGVSMVPELEAFYEGQGGILFVALIFLSSIIMYILINNAKEVREPVVKKYNYLMMLEKNVIIKKALDNYIEKNYGKMLMLRETLKKLGESISPRQLLLKRMLYSVITFILSVLLVFYIHENKKDLLTEKVSNIETLTTATNEEQLSMLSETILMNVDKYKNKSITKEELIEELSKNEKTQVYQIVTNEKIADEIIARVEAYKTEYFKWYELIICIAAAVIAYYVPYWMILYRKRLLKIAMEDEVNQFNSIIYMMMYMNHVTVMDLLEQMELFAVVFKKSLQECMNDYNSGYIEALQRMKEKEAYGPFRRLVDNLIRCDAMSIDKAFDEISSERENYHERRKQENEISIQKRADNTKPMAFVPAVIVTIYLLLPMLAAGMQALQEFRESVSTMGF